MRVRKLEPGTIDWRECLFWERRFWDLPSKPTFPLLAVGNIVSHGIKSESAVTRTPPAGDDLVSVHVHASSSAGSVQLVIYASHKRY